MSQGPSNTLGSAVLMGNARLHVGNVYNNSAQQDLESRKASVLAKLSSPYKDRKDLNPERVEGTCEWFLSHELFRRWRSSKTSSFLWVSADPGCGKSVLAKHLVDYEFPTTDVRTTCYFFFKDGFEDQRTATSALRSLLHQLLFQKKALFSEQVLHMFESNGDWLLNSIGELWDLLIKVCCQPEAGEIICILDAYDECNSKERTELAKSLTRFYARTETSAGSLKILLTSRPYFDISEALRGLNKPSLPTIHLAGESEEELIKITLEINLFIRHVTSEITRNLPPEDGELLLQQILNIPHRTYLWVHVALHTIRQDNSLNRKRIHTIASELPKSVDEAYEKILNRAENQVEARRLLQAVVAASRPLTLPEMAVILGIKKEHRSFSDIDLPFPQAFHNYVRELCGLFVSILDSRIFLLHQTAREFLVRSATDLTRTSCVAGPSEPWKHSINIADAHGLLAHACMGYLLLKETSSFDSSVWWTYGEQHYWQALSLMPYAANNWYAHYQAAGLDDEATLFEIVTGPKNDKRGPPWFKYHWTATRDEVLPEDLTSTMRGAYIGALSVVRRLFKEDLDTFSFRPSRRFWTTCSHIRRSALSLAAEQGHGEVVRLLVKGSLPSRLSAMLGLLLDVESSDKHGRSALAYAVLNGHVEVAKVLLDAGADAGKEDELMGTPMIYGLCSRNTAMVELFSSTAKKNGSSLGQVMNDLRIQAWQAVSLGDKGALALLLDSGLIMADENFSHDFDRLPARSLMRLWRRNDGEYFAPRRLLHWAAANVSSSDIIDMLLDRGANIDQADEDGLQAIHWAAFTNNNRKVQYLLERGAAVHAELQQDGITPFDMCASAGIARILVDQGGLPVSLVLEHPALVEAVMCGTEVALDTLLGKGAELLPGLDVLRRLLILSLSYGNIAATSVLLDTALAREWTSMMRMTLIEFAMLDHNVHRRSTNVELLLRRGANPNTTSVLFYGTAVSWPLLCVAGGMLRDADLMKLLLNHGAQPDARFHDNRPKYFSLNSPLVHLLAENGFSECLKVLVTGGADVNAEEEEYQGKYGPKADQSPSGLPQALATALLNGHDGCARLLLEHGADPNKPYLSPIRQRGWETPLHLVVWRKDRAMAKLMLECGADPVFMRADDRKATKTPLDLAREHDPHMAAMFEEKLRESAQHVETSVGARG